MTGTRPAVWAPRPERVELVLGAERHAMRRREDGWWHADVELPPGTDYAFSLDGGEPVPDPRSPWQPSGVHGPSRTVDHDAFAWTDSGWQAPPLADAVIYEAHVGTFSPDGTFDAAIERLPDLADLGVTHLELMPVVEFSGDRGWGYDGVDLFAPHHAYGGPDGLKRLIDAAHAHGLAVLIDVVYNHLGPEGNYLSRFGPYFSHKYATPWGDAVNFDERGSHEVRRFVVDNALLWLRDYHADGLRLDAMQAIFDMSAVQIGEEIATAVHRLGEELRRRLVVTAESDLNDPRLVRRPARGGYGMDAAWADDVHHALHAALSGETNGYYVDFTDAAALPRALHDPYLYADRYSAHRGRRHGRAADDVPGDRFIACLQNHDQVGNRARGDRLAQVVSPGRARIGAALLLTSPYVPLLFAGEEWGASTPFRYFTGHASPELAQAVREGRRNEFVHFGWDPADVPDPQDPETFHDSKLRWDERREPEHAAMLEWYRSLIALRRELPELRDGDRSAVGVDGRSDSLLTVRRGRVTVAANLGTGPAGVAASGDIRLAWPPELALDAGDGSAATVPPDGVVVLVERR
ncbi:MAG TPA: malto-oligosyltrehalose trehalohydrolase [Candidatus Limnocylindria bacterium]|nr:malto-oligosyltrehalose trehalohydrolase [Candidatus Limnocylindria bacterium]